MKKIRERRLDEAGIVNQEVWWINKDEVRAAMKRMKSGKAVEPYDISVEVIGEMAVEFFTNLLYTTLESERMPEEWRRSVLVLIFKNNGEMQSSRNYNGIQSICHRMKLQERVVEARLRGEVMFSEQ